MATKVARLSKRYAKMLFNTTGPEEAEKVLEQLDVLNEVIQTDRGVKNFFMNPKITEEERQKAIDAVGEKLGLSEKVKKFLEYIVDRRAIVVLDDIIRHFRSLYYEKKRKAKAIVIAPISVNSKYQERLREALRRITQREVELEFQVDPDLLGGIVVKVGSTMYDSSIKGQLRLLKEELIKG